MLDQLTWRIGINPGFSHLYVRRSVEAWYTSAFDIEEALSVVGSGVHVS